MDDLCKAATYTKTPKDGPKGTSVPIRAADGQAIERHPQYSQDIAFSVRACRKW